MNIHILNTETKHKEELAPLSPERVTMYHCGPTVYWTQHIGNMRAVVMADIVVRTLTYFGYDVEFVRNYTDVGHLSGDNDGNADSGEDRMEKGAKREGVTAQEIAEKYIAEYDRDIELLNTILPAHRPKATEHIQEIINMIQVLLDNGCAYTTDLAIYFDISKAERYHRLTGQKIEENIQGAGTGDVTDTNKKHPADFALWFFRAGVHKNALQYWPSPFESPLVEDGVGFPGWHIECSAMSKKYLGDTIDIHMGGIEHIPIHHTNEIAQSESANGKPFVKYWIHNEHLLVDNAKMSKSEGTSYSLQEIIKKGFDPLALRYFFLQSHYRSKQNFTWDALEAAQRGLANLYRQARSLGDETGVVNDEYKERFKEALADDFNTPKALALVSELLKSDISNEVKKATLIDYDNVLGLHLDKGLETNFEEVPQEILDLVEKRERARKGRDFETSDRLRDEIKSLGYEVLDTDDGPETRAL